MNKAKKLVNKMAKKSAEKAANSACCFWAYQPKEPKAVTNEYDSDEEKEIIAYGLERIRENVLAFGFTVLVGFCYGDVLSGVLLWVFLYPIRSSAGGYHAQTRWGCRVMSVSLLLAA